MADLNRNRNIKHALIGALIGMSTSAFATVPNPQCFNALKKERAAILEKFGKLQNYKTYTDAKARKLQDRVEKYLIAIGDVLENFNLDDFFKEELVKISEVKGLSAKQRGALSEVLKPSFESRRLPSLSALRKNLNEVGLGELPARKIRETMDHSFRIWRTKLIFDETGSSVYNQLAKKYVANQGIKELSMQLGLLGKNEWEAFFEAEKGAGIFNPSMPGMMADLFTSIEAHESIHMVVQTLAARGHLSPYSVWIKVDKKYKPTGAVGSRQKKALAGAEDPLSDGDYYRTELYRDELPAHIIQSSFLNVQLSKAVRTRFDEMLESVRRKATREELELVYADQLRAEKIDWSEYSDETKKIFDRFLDQNASDGRTKIAKLLKEMTEYVNWVDLLNDGSAVAEFEARKIIEQEIAIAAKKGLKGLHPKPGDRIAIKPDVFLGKKGYRIEVRIPVDLLQQDENFIRTEQGATVNFRFSGSEPSESITPKKIDQFMALTDWGAELAGQFQKEVQAYSEFLDETGALNDYTFADVFKMKQIHTNLRKITRETLERIRASR